VKNVWRIASWVPNYKPEDLNGVGGLYVEGRWNTKGMQVVYTSSNIALCVLETIVHLKANSLPLNRYLVKIQVPDELWEQRRVIDDFQVPQWSSIPHSTYSQEYGDGWLRQRTELLLEVPSAIVHEESNILINPMHPDLNQLQAKQVRLFTYDPRIKFI